jgi:S-adenosylmethionine hydrolase
MPTPIIAVLTDFGLRDHYTGTMKGVALGVCRDITFVDITHDIPPHDVMTGALELAAAYRYFPSGTIFLAVVDPGVGSTRKGIAAETADYRFVAPDNGVLSVVFDEIAPTRIVELTEGQYARPTLSRTFEGRDRFAPAAAWLATGLDLGALGVPAGPIRRLEVPKPHVIDDVIEGEVLRVDRFGNLITNIDRRTLDAFTADGRVTVRISARRVSNLVPTYGEVRQGDLCALVGSSEHLEIAINGASAEKELATGRGAAVHVQRGA